MTASSLNNWCAAPVTAWRAASRIWSTLGGKWKGNCGAREEPEKPHCGHNDKVKHTKMATSALSSLFTYPGALAPRLVGQLELFGRLC
jgi:hypothetical protein